MSFSNPYRRNMSSQAAGSFSHPPPHSQRAVRTTNPVPPSQQQRLQGEYQPQSEYQQQQQEQQYHATTSHHPHPSPHHHHHRPSTAATTPLNGSFSAAAQGSHNKQRHHYRSSATIPALLQELKTFPLHQPTNYQRLLDLFAQLDRSLRQQQSVGGSSSSSSSSSPPSSSSHDDGWTVDCAVSLVTSVLRVLFFVHNHSRRDDNHSHENAATVDRAAWRLLCVGLQTWNDAWLYAVAVHEWHGRHLDHRPPYLSLDTSHTLLGVLECMLLQAAASASSEHSTTCTQSGTLIALSLVWRALERLAMPCPLSPAPHNNADQELVWWMRDRPELKRVILACTLRLWLHPDHHADETLEISDASILNPVETQTATALLCRRLLQHAPVDPALTDCCFHNDEDVWQSLADQLVQQAQRLRESMPFSSYAKLAVASLELLLVMDRRNLCRQQQQQQDYKALLRDASIWRRLWETTLDGTSLQLWKPELCTVWTLPLLDQYLQWTSDPSMDAVLEHYTDCTTHDLARALWKILLVTTTNKGAGTNHRLFHNAEKRRCLLRRLCWLWTRAPVATSHALWTELESSHEDNNNTEAGEEDSSLPRGRLLLQTLVAASLEEACTEHGSTALESAMLLRLMLSHRNSVTTHDAVSQALWQHMDLGTLQQIWEQAVQVVQVSGHDSKNCLTPMALALCDILCLVLSFHDQREHCFRLLADQPAQSLEAFITRMSSANNTDMHIFDPTQSTIDANDQSMDSTSDHSTPTVNNLSRIFEDDHPPLVAPPAAAGAGADDSSRAAVGLDWNLRITTATVLSNVVASLWQPIPTVEDEEAEDHVSLLRNRAEDATVTFLTSHVGQLLNQTDSQVSNENLRRLSAFFKSLVHANKGDLVASIVFSSLRVHHDEIRESRDELARVQRALATSRETIQQWEAKHEGLLRQLRAQKRDAEQETGLLQERASQQARQWTEAHTRNAKKAEARCATLAMMVQDLQAQLTEAQEAAEASRQQQEQVQQEMDQHRQEFEQQQQRLEEANRSLEASWEENQKLLKVVLSNQETATKLQDDNRHYCGWPSHCRWEDWRTIV